jgi:hypothetical protein
MIDLTKPVDASYELNNICNLMCPQCARNTIKDGVFYDVLQLSWEDKSTCLKPCSNTCSFSKDATRESARTSNYRVYV